LTKTIAGIACGIVVATVLASGQPLAHAASPPSPAGVKAISTSMAGGGIRSCGEFIQDRRKAQATPGGAAVEETWYVSWVQGYMTGLNVALGSDKGVAAIPNPGTILAYVDKYCRENPLGGVWSGISQLYLELPKSSIK